MLELRSKTPGMWGWSRLVVGPIDADPGRAPAVARAGESPGRALFDGRFRVSHTLSVSANGWGVTPAPYGVVV